MNDNFLKMLELASSIKKPVIIHSRKAEKEVIDILSSFDIKAQMHCYGGKLKLAKQAIEQGIIFSIPPNIVKNQAFEKLVEILRYFALIGPFSKNILITKYQGKINDCYDIACLIYWYSKVYNKITIRRENLVKFFWVKQRKYCSKTGI